MTKPSDAGFIESMMTAKVKISSSCQWTQLSVPSSSAFGRLAIAAVKNPGDGCDRIVGNRQAAPVPPMISAMPSSIGVSIGIGAFYLPGEVVGLGVDDVYHCSADAVGKSTLLVVKRSALLRWPILTIRSRICYGR